MKSVFVLLAAPLLLTGAAATPAHVPAPLTEGTFRAWSEAAPAVTYDVEAVPRGAQARVEVEDTKTGTSVRLKLSGLIPGRVYGAHLHTKPCTDKPAEAGPHYQHRIDPASDSTHSSVDPAYANPENEFWLDFTTDATGAATATSVQNWHVDNARPPWSLVLHAEHTHTAPGQAGTAGARLACMTRTAETAYVNRAGRG
ncbi:superoxide dismutase family protein [Actinoplanes sp. GCM10030250]|uniref:superoxide dismutase family protein n=1 Tax=Actinoplanes sp. GCM10030250 TaxID=3273376 RepID=UPI00360C9BD4